MAGPVFPDLAGKLDLFSDFGRRAAVFRPADTRRCDARKWLANGWVDYLAPQLYWKDQPRKQSFSALLS
ncbi:MAG: hypothetical protein EOP83_24275, partial [Verrucomicrobiaceae bacterium]